MPSDVVQLREAFESFSEGEATTQELLNHVDMNLDSLLLSLADLRHKGDLELVNHEHGDYWRYER